MYECTGVTWTSSMSGYTVPVVEFSNSQPFGAIGPCCPTFKQGASVNGGFTVYDSNYRTYATKQLDPNKCEENCCADDAAITGSLFGCDDCNPFRNSVPVDKW